MFDYTTGIYTAYSEKVKKVNVIGIIESERKYRINQMWRQLARRIFVYLKANPDVLATNNNQEVYNAVRDIQIRHRLNESPDYTYEKAAEFEDFMCELQAKHDGKDYYVAQTSMDLYRPSTERDDTWKTLILAELMTYYVSPESYTKGIHELAEKEDGLP